MVTQLPPIVQVAASRSLLQSVPQDELVRTDADIGPLYASLQYAQVVQGLAEHSATTSTAGAGLGTLVSLSARGVAGNAICEVGELPDAPPNGMGQPPPPHLVQSLMGHETCRMHDALDPMQAA